MKNSNKSRLIPSINSRGTIEYKGFLFSNKRKKLIKYVDTCIKLRLNPNSTILYTIFTIIQKMKKVIK